MGKKRSRPDPSSACEGGCFDMTPMIDVTFLLIIFFMCVTELADASKAKIVLPIADKAETDVHVPGRTTINVLQDGRIQIMGKVREDPELHQLLELERQMSMTESNDEFPNRAILIRADEKTKYKFVQHTMGMCMMHKLWRIAFATRDPNFGN